MLVLITELMIYGPFNSLKEVREKIKVLKLLEDSFEVQVLWG